MLPKRYKNYLQLVKEIILTKENLNFDMSNMKYITRLAPPSTYSYHKNTGYIFYIYCFPRQSQLRHHFEK